MLITATWWWRWLMPTLPGSPAPKSLFEMACAFAFWQTSTRVGFEKRLVYEVHALVHSAALTGMNTNNPLRIFGGGLFNRGAEPLGTVQDAVQYPVHFIVAWKHHDRTYRLIHEAPYQLTFSLVIGWQSSFDPVENLFDFVLAHLLSPIIAPMIIASGLSMTGAVGVYPQLTRRLNETPLSS